jgi:hypothetical protein
MDAQASLNPCIMKSSMEKDKTKHTAKKDGKHAQHKSEELKTEPPIAEKDEVKEAERRMRKNK